MTDEEVVSFINEELCVHEGGISGYVSFGYDDATFDHIVRVGPASGAKYGYGRGGIQSAIADFKKTHRAEPAPESKQR